MNIFESLENLNVSEECFDDIMGLVEELLLERHYSPEEKRDIALKVLPKRKKEFSEATDKLDKIVGNENPDNFSPVKTYKANKAAEKVERAQDRLEHAEEVIKEAPQKLTAAEKRKRLNNPLKYGMD